MSRRMQAGLVVALALGISHRLAAVTLSIPDVTGPPGSSQELCVYLSDSRSSASGVSGVQMDIVWDANCLSMVMGDGDSAACQKNPAVTKETFRTKVMPSGNSMRVLLLSISDTSPMSDGQLFCCPFDIAAAAGGRQCTLMLNNAIASDPVGQKAKDLRAQPGRVIVSGSSGTGGGAQGAGQGPAVPVLPPVVSVPGAAPAAPGAPQAPAGSGAQGAIPMAPVPGVPAGQEVPAVAPVVPSTPQAAPVLTGAPAVGTAVTLRPTAIVARTPTARGTQPAGTKTAASAQTAAAMTPTPKAP